MGYASHARGPSAVHDWARKESLPGNDRQQGRALRLKRMQVTARRKAAVAVKQRGSKHVSVQCVNTSQNLQQEQVLRQSHDNTRQTTVSTGSHLSQQGRHSIKGGTEAKGQSPKIGKRAHTLSDTKRPLSAMESQYRQEQHGGQDQYKA